MSAASIVFSDEKPIPYLTCVLITKNAASTLARTLESVRPLAAELLVIDDMSTDQTAKIAASFGARVEQFPEPHEGRQRMQCLSRARTRWILSLDSDEVVSAELAREIRAVLAQKHPHAGYILMFQNHFLGHPVRYGGESYGMLRLFRKDAVTVDDTPIHSQFHLKTGTPGVLQHKLYHYSYRSLSQVFRKFTAYARREAGRKYGAGERSSIKKLTLYPLHMVWARFIEDKGYKDGLIRLPLDLAFGYMEFMTYWYLWNLQQRNKRTARCPRGREQSS